MRWMHLLLSFVLVTVAVIPLLGSDSPPPVPGASRRRQPVKEWVVKGTLYNYNDATMAAAADTEALANQLSSEELSYCRYLSMHNIPLDYREDYYNSVSFLLNSLKGLGLGEPRTEPIRPGFCGPDNILIRVNLFDYGIDPKAWDRLAKKDPYFHQLITRTEVTTEHIDTGEIKWVVTKETYQAADGKWYYKQIPQKVLTPVTKTSKAVVSRAAAGWCNAAASSVLISKLQTDSPILRADWFARNVTLEPHYSDFLGIKTLDDYKRLVGFDKRAEVTEVRASIVKSGSDGLCPRVAQNNRILARRGTYLGYYWETYDFKTSIGEQNVISNFVNFIHGGKRDAGEFIATAPSGLQVYAIVNDKDELIAKGDNEIVVDTMGHDTIVRNSRSCIYCHAGGINPFKSQFQEQVGARLDQADLAIYKNKPKDALELKRQIRSVFGAPNFEDYIVGDSHLFDKAVRACNGLDAKTNGQLFKRIWEQYDVDRIDMKQLVLESGLYEDDLKAVLGLRMNGRSNGVLIQALLQPPISIRRDQFEENFAELGLLTTLIRPANPQLHTVPK